MGLLLALLAVGCAAPERPSSRAASTASEVAGSPQAGRAPAEPLEASPPGPGASAPHPDGQVQGAGLPGAATAPAAGTSSLYEDARNILVLHCGRCHRSDLPTAVPGALKIFDLTASRWAVTMSDDQLEAASKRLKGMGRKSDGPKLEEQLVFERFVEEEIRVRRSSSKEGAE